MVVNCNPSSSSVHQSHSHCNKMHDHKLIPKQTNTSSCKDDRSPTNNNCVVLQKKVVSVHHLKDNNHHSSIHGNEQEKVD